MNEINPSDLNTQHEEIQRLQEALAWSLEENRRLKEENNALNHQTKAIVARQEKAAAQEAKVLKSQNRKLNQQLQTANYRLSHVQKQYNVLANSKLGRLTLNFWAWKKEKQGNLGSLSI